MLRKARCTCLMLGPSLRLPTKGCLLDTRNASGRYPGLPRVEAVHCRRARNALVVAARQPASVARIDPGTRLRGRTAASRRPGARGRLRNEGHAAASLLPCATCGAVLRRWLRAAPSRAARAGDVWWRRHGGTALCRSCAGAVEGAPATRQRRQRSRRCLRNGARLALQHRLGCLVTLQGSVELELAHERFRLSLGYCCEGSEALPP